MKTQWYDCWINSGTLRKRTSKAKVARELDQIHAHLRTFEMPEWLARLPRQVGYPAGGSLGADEWKCMAMAYCPIVVRTHATSTCCRSPICRQLLIGTSHIGPIDLGGMAACRTG